MQNGVWYDALSNNLSNINPSSACKVGQALRAGQIDWLLFA
jgi:hypothetical protein